MPRKEVYISVDIEASGQIPGEYSMLSIGACVVGDLTKTFYVELKPLNENFKQESLDVCGLNMEVLAHNGEDPRVAMERFEAWVQDVTQDNVPIFTAFNASFDWMFIQYYFHRFLDRSPFGYSGLDVKAYYMGMQGCTWADTAKWKLSDPFKPTRTMTHNALEDAKDQAEIFEKILTHNKASTHLEDIA